MDSKYPHLARPQKKLRYFPNKVSTSTMKGNAKLDIDDSSTWFKDLDSPSDMGEELPSLPPSPTFAPVEEGETGNPVEEKVEREPSPVPETPSGEGVPQGEEMHKEGRAEITLLDNESPFKERAPMKTSSPLEWQEGEEVKDKTASPLLLSCDDDDDDEYDHCPVKQPFTALTQQCNEQAADGGCDAVLDSPPCRFSVGKQNTPAHRMTEEEETPWKLRLSLCSTETEPEEPPHRSPYPAVEPKEQPAPEKKSLAQPPEKKSLAQPPEKKSLAQLPEKKSLAQPPEKKSLAQPPEKKSLAQPPEKKSLAQPPEKKSLAQPPEKKSLAQPPEKKSLAQPPEKKSLAQPPEKKSLAQPPEKKSLAQPPEKKSLAQPPEKKSLAQPPEKKSLAQPPEINILAQPPEINILAQPPEINILAQPPEINILAQPPEINILAQPPEINILAQPPEKRSLAQQPEKRSLAQQPEKRSLAQQPEKRSLAQQPEKRSLAQQPEKRSLAQQPEKRSLAQQPEKRSLAQQPEKRSLAQQPEKRSLAQQPEKRSLAQQPEKRSLAQQPEKRSLAQQPEKRSLAQPPEKRSLAQPPEKEATQERKATSSFLQKLREAGQSKPACPRKALASPVREPPLTELEDDFLILEDDGPSWFSLRRKIDPNRSTAKPRPQQQNQSHSSDNASADTLTKATANQRSGGTDRPRTTKEKKGKNPTTRKEKDSSPQGVGPQGDGPVNHVDLEADHIEQDKKKGNNLLSEPTTAGDLEQEAPGGAKPKPSHTKTEKKVPRISKSKAGIQGDKVNPKTSRGRGRQSGKTRRLSGRAGEEPVTMEEESEAAADQSSAEDQAADQDVSPVLQLAPTGQRRVISKVPANCKAQEVCPAPTGEADSSQLARKRKRTKPGPWWLTSPVNTQLTETDNKSKQNNKTTSKLARYSSVESGQEDGPSKPLFNQNAKKKPSSNQTTEKKPSSNQTTEKKPCSNQTAEQKAEKPKKGRPKKQTTARTEEPARPEGQREEEPARPEGQREEEPARPEGQREEEPARPEGQREEEQEAMPSPLRQHTLTSSEKVFDWIYTRTPKCKPQSDATPHSATVTPSRSDATPHSATVTPSRQQHQAREAPEKRSSRRRKAPVNWWETNNPPENAGRTCSFPQQPQPYPKTPSSHQPQPNPKTRKVVRSKSKPRPVRTRPAKSLGPPQNGNTASSPRPGAVQTLGPPQNGNTASSPRPGAVQTLVKRKDPSTPKTAKRSLATFGAIFSSGREALPVATVRSTLQTSGRKALFPEEQSAQSPSVSLSPGPAKDPSQDTASDRSSSPVDLSASTVYIEPVGQLGKKTRRRDFSQSNNRLSDNTLKGFKSGPSSMIELEDCEEHEDIWLPSSRVTPHPSVHPSVPPGIVLSDPEAVTAAVCAPPLKAITLQLEDKANLTDWLALLWPATGKQGGQISPDHFQWFSYRNRALGYKMDLLAETFSNGKILLGSYMKKPLLVDHSATTVYNLLTSSVTVTINGKENHYNPGQTFMVPCGHAYSLHNLTQEPAALHFTRMLAESSE